MRRLSAKFYDGHKIPSDNVIPAEEVYERYNRDLALKLACNSGNEQCLSDTAAQIHRFASLNIPVPKGLENNIYCSGLRGTGKQDDWVSLWRKMSSTPDATLKTQLIAALGCTDDTEALKDYLESTLGAGNSVNYTQAQRRNVLSAVLNSHSGLEVVINFFKDFELNIMSSFGYSLENLLNVAAVTVKTRDQQIMFTDYLFTLTHLDSEAFRRLTTTATNSVQNQLQRQNANFLDTIITLNEAWVEDTTTVIPSSTPEPPGTITTSSSTVTQSTQTSPGVTQTTEAVTTQGPTSTLPTNEGTSPTAETTTQGASTISIKLVTLFTSVLVAYTLKY